MEARSDTTSGHYDRVTIQRHERKEQVCDHLLGIFSDKQFCDVEISCYETVFPCHRLVLAANSPVFRAMLLADMMEKRTKTIIIEDSKPETVAAMLSFIYTGDIADGKLSELAVDLLEVADKYQLGFLSMVCEDKLCSTLEVENSIECLVLGDMYHAFKLKKMALYVVANNLDKIVVTDMYRDLLRQKPELALDLDNLATSRIHLLDEVKKELN